MTNDMTESDLQTAAEGYGEDRGKLGGTGEIY